VSVVAVGNATSAADASAAASWVSSRVAAPRRSATEEAPTVGASRSRLGARPSLATGDGGLV
jgi:hypothetical protein